MSQKTMAVAAVCLIGFAVSSHATPVLSFDIANGTLLNSAQSFSIGWSFTTSQQSTVIALDALDTGGPDGREVRLYDGLGTLIASATVMPSDPQEGSPLFHSHSIAPVTLTASSTYYIVQDVPGGTSAWFGVAAPVTVAEIAYDGPVSVEGLGLNPITDLAAGVLAPGYFGPNFDVAIPEPAAILAFGMGLTALGLVSRRQKPVRTRSSRG